MDKGVQEYGPHLLLDGYGADSSKLGDINLIYGLLEELPGLIGMERVGLPQIARFTDFTKAGVSGFVMIVTSHISIHTYTLKRCFFMDIFSCQPFDQRAVIKYVREKFAVESFEARLVKRGRKFPLNNLGVKPKEINHEE